jgi:hypothetical protein
MSYENSDKRLKVTSVKKLRSLVLICYHDLRLLKYIQIIIKEANSVDHTPAIFEKMWIVITN